MKKTPLALKRLQADAGFVEEKVTGVDVNHDGRILRSESLLKVSDIKEKLLELGLSTKGLKNELQERLANGASHMMIMSGSRV